MLTVLQESNVEDGWANSRKILAAAVVLGVWQASLILHPGTWPYDGGKLQPTLAAPKATERVVGGLPKQNGLMSPADASLGKVKGLLGSEERRHLTCVNNAWCTVLAVLLVWAGKRPWHVLSGVMTRPHYTLMAMVFLYSK